MTEAPPAPPQAPSAPPAAPAAPAPAPSNSASRSTGPNMDTAFSGFDSLIAPETERIAADKAAAAKPPEKPAEKIDAKSPEQKLDEKSPEQKPPAPKPGEPVKPVKAATLREELDRTRSEVADWKGKYEKAIAEAKTTKPDPEKEQLLKDRETWNKSRDEYEQKLKFAAYEQSTEYKDKYQQPFLNAYEQGKKIITALTLKEPDKTDDLGMVTTGASRKGTEADWDKLMAITDEDAANKFIAENFGYNAARVTMQRDKVLDLHNQMRNAVEDFRKQSGTRETETKAQIAKAQQETSERWHAANKLALEKFPQYFAPDEADAKGNELLTYGTRLTDLAFGVLDPSEFAKLPKSLQDKMVNGELPAQEKTMLHSAIRNRSAAYDRLVYRMTQKDAELKAALEKLAGYEKSEPGPGETRRVEPSGKKKLAGSFAEADEAFDRLAAGNG